MAARGWTALLLLAAVFAMHGVQCATAADGPGHAATSLGHSLASGEPSSRTAHAPAHAHAIAAAGVALAVPVAAAPLAGHPDSVPAAAGPAGAGGAGVPFHAAGHLWTVCLAVLAAALAVLLATSVPRAAHLSVPAVLDARTRLWSSRPPRPPDLSALCLLRI